MNRVLVTKDVNFGASKTSATKNTALTPYDLADGALGIYGIMEGGSTNLNKLVLIGDGGSESAGYVPAASFVGDKIMLAVGTADSAVISPELSRTGMQSFNKAYTAAVKGVAYVGYNAVTGIGDISFPATINKNDEVLLTANDVSNPDNILRTGTPYSGYAAIDGASDYDILSDLVDNVYADSQRKFNPDIVGDGTKTAVTAATSGANNSILVVGAGTPAVTGTIANGDTALTLTLASSTVSSVNFAAGDYIEIAGIVYKISAVGATGAITLVLTLDRVYRGTSLSGAAASNFKFFNTADPANWGLVLTDRYDNNSLQYGISNIGAAAPIVYQTVATRSSGAYQDILDKEVAYRANRGTLESIDRRVPVPSYLVAAGTNYDQYIVKGGNQGVEKGIQNLHNIDISIHVAFPDGIADSAGKNQSDFEDVMATTGFVSGFVSII